MPFVSDWNAYVPEPVRVRNPVLANPVMLSKHVPLAAEQFVPPEETGTGFVKAGVAAVSVPRTVTF